MITVNNINELKKILDQQKSLGKTIGLVPTMGYLHEGHISLANMSKKENDFTVMTIFVNPTQFGVNEDLDKYPRDLKGDSEKAESAGVDVIFAPTVKEMYPDGYNTFVEVFGLTDKLCGKSRPTHFRGVTTVVAKLFNIVDADRAYFGQKDAQQVIVIKRMASDLNMKVKIVTCPIIREQDGLAMSSRNVFLSSDERKAAVVLSKSLFEAKKLVEDGERSAAKVYSYIYYTISSEKLANIDYIEIADIKTLEKVETIKDTILIALAVKFGNTRLIDNIILEVE